jgi:hypothetical protein
MSIDLLESFVDKPEVMGISLSIDLMKEVIIEIASRVDSIAQPQRRRDEEMEERVRPEDLRVISNRVDSWNAKVQSIPGN